MSMAVVLGGAEAYVNWGRWLVDCVSPFCCGAVQVQRGQVSAWCRDCGTPIPVVVWPADPVGVETLLVARPDAKSRNWVPSESLHDLLMENAAHGILPRALDRDGGGQELLVTQGGRVVGGLVGLELADAVRRRQIESNLFASEIEGR